MRLFIIIKLQKHLIVVQNDTCVSRLSNLMLPNKYVYFVYLFSGALYDKRSLKNVLFLCLMLASHLIPID
jgi:hypothetical protein